MELAGGELGGPGCGPGHEVGDPDAPPDQVPAVRVGHAGTTVDHPVDHPGAQQGRVEPVARVGEVGRRGGGPQPGVDADEQQPQAGPDEVGDRGVTERLELGPAEAHAGRGYGVAGTANVAGRCRSARGDAPSR